MSKFDFFGVNDQGTAKMIIINPNTGASYRDKDGVEAYIEIGHIHGPEGRAFDNEFQRRAALQEDLPGLSPTESYMVRKFAALAKGWYFVGTDGEPVDEPFTKEAAIELFARRWLYVQLAAFTSAYANFSKALPKNS